MWRFACGRFDLETLGTGIPDEAYKPIGGDDKNVARQAKRRNAEERAASLFHAEFAGEIIRIAEELRAVDKFPEDTIEQVRKKAEVCARIERSAEFGRIRLACDAWTAAFFQPYPNPSGVSITTETVRSALSRGVIPDARQAGFPLAFPEVFAGRAFDVMLGNPPFVGGHRISADEGTPYRKYLAENYLSMTGKTDLCALFFRRAIRAVRDGAVGMIATNTIAQGDTREASLAVLLRDGAAITFAQRFVKWPGMANVEVNLLALRGREGIYTRELDGQIVDFISSKLDDEPEAEASRLRSNRGLAFRGLNPRGAGFIIDPSVAQSLLEHDPRSSECLAPFLNGDDLNSDPESKPSRFIINFGNCSLEEAEDFPNLLEIVRRDVLPQRLELDDEIGGYHRLRELWWQFEYKAEQLHGAAHRLGHGFARARLSEYHMIVRVPGNWLFGEQTIFFAFDDYYHFALLQSHLHEAWVWKNSSSLESRNRYTPTDCFETFAFPVTEAARSDGPDDS